MTEQVKAPNSGKPVNYPEKDAAELLAAFESAPRTYEAQKAVIDEYADKLKKSARSVRMKVISMLATEGRKDEVYVQREYRTKTGAKSVKKADIVEAIAAVDGRNSEFWGSLESATKPVCAAVFNLAQQVRELTKQLRDAQSAE